MGLSNAALNQGADAIAAGAGWISLHDGDPGAAGANEIPGVARKAAAWAPAGGSGDTTTGPHLFTGAPANQPVTHFGLWSSGPGIGGTWKGGDVLTGD